MLRSRAIGACVLVVSACATQPATIAQPSADSPPGIDASPSAASIVYDGTPDASPLPSTMPTDVTISFDEAPRAGVAAFLDSSPPGPLHLFVRANGSTLFDEAAIEVNTLYDSLTCVTSADVLSAEIACDDPAHQSAKVSLSEPFTLTRTNNGKTTTRALALPPGTHATFARRPGPPAVELDGPPLDAGVTDRCGNDAGTSKKVIHAALVYAPAKSGDQTATGVYLSIPSMHVKKLLGAYFMPFGCKSGESSVDATRFACIFDDGMSRGEVFVRDHDLHFAIATKFSGDKQRVRLPCDARVELAKLPDKAAH